MEANTTTLVAGDFNGDGQQDIAAIGRSDANSTQRSLFVFQGAGDGTFTALPTVPVFQDTDLVDPRWMATEDLNHDGHLDLVTTAAYSRSAVMLGRGDGTFRRPVVYVSGTYFASRRNLYLLDMNADDELDLVTINDNTSRGSIDIRLGLGDGSFGEQRSYDGGDWRRWRDRTRITCRASTRTAIP